MANMIPISTVTVGNGGAATISFTNIPQTYTDLCIKLSGRKAGGAVDIVYLTINGGSTAISSNRYLDSGAGTPRTGAVVGYQAVAQPSDYTANVFGSADLYIYNYTSGQQKVISVESATENNATANYLGFTASLWPSTLPITTLSLTPTGSGWVQYSSATLYGIRKY